MTETVGSVEEIANGSETAAIEAGAQRDITMTTTTIVAATRAGIGARVRDGGEMRFGRSGGLPTTIVD